MKKFEFPDFGAATAGCLFGAVFPEMFKQEPSLIVATIGFAGGLILLAILYILWNLFRRK